MAGIEIVKCIPPVVKYFYIKYRAMVKLKMINLNENQIYPFKLNNQRLILHNILIYYFFTILF